MRRSKLQDLHVRDIMSTDLVTVTVDDTLGDALGKMKRHEVHELPVLRGKVLAGLVTLNGIIRRKALPHTTKVSTLLQPASEVTPDDDLPTVAEKLIQSGFRAMPVVEGKRLVGIVSRTDLAKVVANLEDFEGVQVADLMVKNGISSVIVVEKDEPVGVVTKLDLTELLVGRKEREEVLVQISGLEDEQPDVYEGLYDIIRKTMHKISNVTIPKSLIVHVQAYKAEGDRAKYSLHARFQTAHKMYYLAHFDWDLNLAMAGLMDILEKQILKAKERRVTDRLKTPPSVGRGTS